MEISTVNESQTENHSVPTSIIDSHQNNKFFGLPSKQRLKREFIICTLVSISLCALIGIFLLTTSSFDATDGRIFLSTLSVGVFSTTSLAGLRNLDSINSKLRIFSLTCILLSIAALASMLVLIWTFSPSNFVWETAAILTIIAFTTAHMSLLLPVMSKGRAAEIITLCTFLFILLVAGMLIYLVLDNSHTGLSGAFWRATGVFAILDAVGSIVGPVTARLTIHKS